MYVEGMVYAQEAGTWKGMPEESVRFGETGLSGSYEPPDTVAGNQPWVFCKNRTYI